MDAALVEMAAIPHMVGRNVSGSVRNNGTVSGGILSSFAYIRKVYRSTGLMAIRYDDSYVMDLAEFDGRRQTIVAVYNGFNAELHMLSQGTGSISRLNERASLLVRLMGEYFSFEEAVMRETEYPEFAAHRAKHIRFLENLHTEFDSIQRGRADMHDLSYLIGSWLADHMRGMDRALGTFVVDAVGAAADDDDA